MMECLAKESRDSFSRKDSPFSHYTLRLRGRKPYIDNTPVSQQVLHPVAEPFYHRSECSSEELRFVPALVLDRPSSVRRDIHASVLLRRRMAQKVEVEPVYAAAKIVQL